MRRVNTSARRAFVARRPAPATRARQERSVLIARLDPEERAPDPALRRSRVEADGIRAGGVDEERLAAGQKLLPARRVVGEAQEPSPVRSLDACFRRRLPVKREGLGG